ncbi:MAG: OmpA family protein [Terricaulis silvestris]
MRRRRKIRALMAMLALSAGIDPSAFADDISHSAPPQSTGPSTADLSQQAAPNTSDGRWTFAHAATALAPVLSASSDTCMGSRTLGVQGIRFGVSLGATWRDTSCRRLKNARALDDLGYHEAALQLLCMDRDVRAAMRRAGTPCSGTRTIQMATPAPFEPRIERIEAPTMGRYEVLFDFDSARLRPESDIILQPLLEMLQASPDSVVDVEGHADWIGSDAYNLRLSRRRAEAVVAWLVAHGVARERLYAVGKGEAQPIDTNRTAIGRAHNRRVEVRRHVSA